MTYIREEIYIYLSGANKFLTLYVIGDSDSCEWILKKFRLAEAPSHTVAITCNLQVISRMFIALQKKQPNLSLQNMKNYTLHHMQYHANKILKHVMRGHQNP